MTPTARSLAYLRKLGVAAAVVERWNQYAKIRQDLFNFADVVAIVPPAGFDDGHILALQVTADEGGHVSNRFKKIANEPKAKLWLEAGGRIVVHGWGKKGSAGKRKLWTLRVVPVTLADFPTHDEVFAEKQD